MSNNKTLIAVIAAVAVIIIIIGVIYWQSQKGGYGSEEKSLQNLTDTLGDAASDLEIDPQSNPLEKLPETNPLDKTNPFKEVKTNPFK